MEIGNLCLETSWGRSQQNRYGHIGTCCLRVRFLGLKEHPKLHLCCFRLDAVFTVVTSVTSGRSLERVGWGGVGRGDGQHPSHFPSDCAGQSPELPCRVRRPCPVLRSSSLSSLGPPHSCPLLRLLWTADQWYLDAHIDIFIHSDSDSTSAFVRATALISW